MLIRHPDQTVATPGFETIEPPAFFAEEAYALGVARGSGTIKLVQVHRSITAMFTGNLRGIRVRVRAWGETNDEAARGILRELRRLSHDG